MVAAHLAGVADSVSDAEMIALATRLEGHPDNVAPGVLGGATIAWMQSSEVGPVGRATRFAVHPGIAPVLVIPASEASTAKARGALPAIGAACRCRVQRRTLGAAGPRAVDRPRPAPRGDRGPAAPAAAPFGLPHEHGPRGAAALDADPCCGLGCRSGRDRLRGRRRRGRGWRPGSSTWSAIPRACCRCRCPIDGVRASVGRLDTARKRAERVSRHLSSGCYRVCWISTVPRTGWRDRHRVQNLTPDA